VDWRPIETAPKDGTRILLWPCSVAKKPQIDIGYWHQPANERFGGFWCTARRTPTPFLWMPLPENPPLEAPQNKERDDPSR